MILFPAIDIKDGKCVRLTQGNYDQVNIYSDSPVTVAKEWEAQGAAYLHLVDLDGAKSGVSTNQPFIREIAKETSLPTQVGGGIRSLQVMEAYLSAGIDRVILGTAAIKDETFLQAALTQYPNRVAVSIDARNGYVATDGWTKTSTVNAIDLVKELESMGLQTVIYTDILKDGMLKGPNFQGLARLQDATSMEIIASGGVTTIKDITALAKMGLYGAIIGKALYDGSLTLPASLEAVKTC
ncbi:MULTISPECIES: 1-(5-phosphoribosyl)-5-[(5-phosphoribosylamino)methylideneamino]imidazole-4-carboxamide isomerase [unclassified Virgibacillus]|uniref:1-(5-phosphoribosyl)-5-[(5- phosphoribosylamino)methylideneamino]imidazole-4- carboxamide isomerase n=1 Tax=unclassified Virgibacillus TaxID=2620237 RepID=UPI00090AD03F|nr:MULTISPECIES: 1-(5-phosphoribosyl)-5-[(5-phosphoribosylamino)methylideneamino]imidazole-4-carboxamide isomerase [unclassified Virgibacillus]API92904.1 1-(5-phosphoribosyl)-5-[(5-phosphoribosylamino)methylideneamino]imidazole-4-carboxamide isomerase [Virgibacillus sp. 6R]MBS7428421.1 1-(5-phosphoribosyl)-5-[(5-phosphoribosylamino)methylideneamino]imidazole-4-carboxamide isomerase [Virgibacillus sp. 19R1-5]